MEKQFCDLCEKEIIGWESAAGYLNIVFCMSSSNQLHKMRFGQGNFQRSGIKIVCICYACQRKVHDILINSLSQVVSLETVDKNIEQV